MISLQITTMLCASLAACQLLANASTSIAPVAAPVETLALGKTQLPFHTGQLKTLDSEALQEELSKENLMRHLEEWESYALKRKEGNRVAGSTAHNQTLEYILDLLDQTNGYYEVKRIPFQAKTRVSGSMAVYLKDHNGVEVGAYYAFPQSVAKIQDYTGSLVRVDNWGCDATDYPSNAEGNLVFLTGNQTTVAEKPRCPLKNVLDAAHDAGVQGIVSNICYRIPTCDKNEKYELSSMWDIPVAFPFPEESRKILQQIERRPYQLLEATISVNDQPCREVHSYNIVAESKAGNESNVLMLGAHSDSVASGPGINDNGSGSAALLELALLLSQYRVQNKVRFAWWTAEESGLLGATDYVAKASKCDLDKIRLYLNFDMIASPNFVLGSYDGDGKIYGRVGPPGSDHAKKLFDDFFKGVGYMPSSTPFDGRSDYRPFLDANIPAGGVFTGADKRMQQ